MTPEFGIRFLLSAAGLTLAALFSLASAVPLDVVVSVPPQAALVEAVGGDLITVHTAVPPGASPHTFSPTPRQVAAMAGAVMYVATGVEVELQLLPRLQALRPDLVVVGEPATKHHHHGDHHGHCGDPHRWLDPRLAADDVDAFAAALAALCPDAADDIARRAARERARLEALHAELARILAPVKGQDLVVDHPAFGQLASAYGLNQVAMEQDGREPTPRQLGALMQRSLTVVFVQPQSSRAQLASLLRYDGLKLVEIDPLASDYHANMVVMAQTIAEALSDAP